MYLAVSVGKMPANTIGLTFLKPGSCGAGRSASVTVSPILVSCTLLMLAMTKPTSPAASDSSSRGKGVYPPTESTSNSFSVATRRILVPLATVPLTTRTRMTTPRKLSYQESKMRAWSGASGLPEGGGMCLTTASSTSWMPLPSFAEASTAPLVSRPMTSSI